MKWALLQRLTLFEDARPSLHQVPARGGRFTTEGATIAAEAAND